MAAATSSHLGITFLTWLACCAAFYLRNQFLLHDWNFFGRRKQPHELEPEILNFGRVDGPYHRPSYKTKKLFVTPFVNELTLGDIKVCQSRQIHTEDTVDIILDSTAHSNPTKLFLRIPGDPQIPIDLVESVNSLFESPPSNFFFADHEDFELCLTRINRESFRFDAISKDWKDNRCILSYRDLSEGKGSASF